MTKWIGQKPNAANTYQVLEDCLDNCLFLFEALISQ